MEQPPPTSPLLDLVNKIRKVYWRTFNPIRHGVKGLVVHPDDPDLFLVVRQSYGNSRPLTLPGGGYKPSREEAEDALRREVHQEVGLKLSGSITDLGETISRLEGKVDRVSYFAATALSDSLTLNREIAEARWTATSLESLDPTDVSSHVYRAIQDYKITQA